MFQKSKAAHRVGDWYLLPPGKYKDYRICRYNKRTRQTDRIKTGTTDPKDAEIKLAEHRLIHSEDQLKDEPLLNSTNRYYLGPGHKLASEDFFRDAVQSTIEVLGSPLVSEMGKETQKKLIKAWRNGYPLDGGRHAKPVSDGTILRRLGCLWAAMNHAAEEQHLNPHIIPKRIKRKTWQCKVGHRTKVLSPEQMARLLDSTCVRTSAPPPFRLVPPRGRYTSYCTYYRVNGVTLRHSKETNVPGLAQARHEQFERDYRREHPATSTLDYGVDFRFMVSLIGMAAREEALLDLCLLEPQLDMTHGIIDLNPQGREQTKKYRPTIPMAPTLRRWMEKWSQEPLTPVGHLLGVDGKRLETGRALFAPHAKRCGDSRVTSYTFRHSVSTWLARHVHSPWERDQFMGWQRSEGSAMGANYNHYDPRYLREAAEAIEALFQAIAPHMVGDLLLRGFEGQPAPEDAWLGAPSLTWPAPSAHAIMLWPARESARSILSPQTVMVGASGIEPPTTCMSSRCSTTELRASADPNPVSGGGVEDPNPTSAWQMRGRASTDTEQNQPLTTTQDHHVKVNNQIHKSEEFSS